MPHRRKIVLELRQQVGIRAALEHLCDKRAARPQHIGGKGRRGFDETDDAELVGLAMACRIGRHVGEHDIRASIHHRDQLVRRIGIEKIELGERHADDLGHLQKIDGDHPALTLNGADALRRDLAPAARRRAEIDHRQAGFKEPVLVVHLDQLVGGARPPAVAFGLRDVGIVELPFQPEF